MQARDSSRATPECCAPRRAATRATPLGGPSALPPPHPLPLSGEGRPSFPPPRRALRPRPTARAVAATLRTSLARPVGAGEDALPLDRRPGEGLAHPRDVG